jgi:hypothetical protein
MSFVCLCLCVCTCVHLHDITIIRQEEAEIFKTHARYERNETRAIMKQCTQAIKRKMAALDALPTDLREAALVHDDTPFPPDLKLPLTFNLPRDQKIADYL